MERELRAKERMRSILRREIDLGHIPGACFALWQNDCELLCVIEGKADIDAQKPLKRDALFRIYSMTKPITAVAAMMLVEEKKFKLTDRVAKYLPEFTCMNVLSETGECIPCSKEMTVWNLLSMTSGLVYPDPDPVGQCMQRCFNMFAAENMAGRGPTTRELAALIAKEPLAFEPGTKWRYGLSADVLGAIIEVVSGQKFSEYLQERIFDPLDMVDTGFFVPAEKADRLVQLYKKEESGMVVDTTRHLGLTLCLRPPTFESGGAGLITTLDDYAAFGKMLANRGVAHGKRFLSEDTIEKFQRGMLENVFSDTLNMDALTGYSYGYFMRSYRDPVLAGYRGHIGEFGWDGWTGPYMSIDAKRNTFMLFMTQVSGYHNWEFINEMRGVALSAMEE